MLELDGRRCRLNSGLFCQPRAEYWLQRVFCAHIFILEYDSILLDEPVSRPSQTYLRSGCRAFPTGRLSRRFLELFANVDGEIEILAVSINTKLGTLYSAVFYSSHRIILDKIQEQVKYCYYKQWLTDGGKHLKNIKAK